MSLSKNIYFYAAKCESTVKVVQKRKGKPLYDILLEADDGSECDTPETYDAEKEIATPADKK